MNSRSAPGCCGQKAIREWCWRSMRSSTAHSTHWLVRETIGLWRRTLSRLDVSSRTLFALIDRGSCFAGTLFELALAADRSYMQSLPDDRASEPRIALSAMNAGAYPMANARTRLANRFCAESPPPHPVDTLLACGSGQRGATGHVHARRHRLGRRNPAGAGRTCEPVPRRADRHGSQLALHRAGDDADAHLRPPVRVAELGVPATERGR